MKKQFIKNFLIITGIFSVVVWSCKDDFTEEDLLTQQSEINQQNQAYADSLAAAQQAHADSMNLRRVQYTITVYNASIAAANTGGRTTGVTALDGASVSITTNGAVQTLTTDANGMVVFENVPLGSVAGTVSLADFTTVHFISNLRTPPSSDPLLQAGTLIPLFATSGENTATISGKATYEGNLLNNTEETVPDETVVSFMIDIEDPSFESAYLNREQAFNDLGQLSSIAFEGNFTTTTTGGAYSIELPAAPQGLVYKISFSDFTADQTIAINNYINEPAGSVRDVVTIPTLFSQSRASAMTGDYINIPVLNSVQADIAAPPASGTGAAMTAKLRATSFDAGFGHVVMASGSGYAVNSITIPVTVSGGDYDATVTGATPADMTAITDAAGRVTDLNVTNAGWGYRSRPTITVGGAGGSGAVIVSNYVSLVAPLYGDFGDDTGASSGTVLTSGGSGYVVPPKALFKGITAAGFEETVESNTEILNGSVVDVASPVTGFRSAPTVEFKNIKRTQSFAIVTGIFSGEITGAGINNAGAGYNPLAPPAITFRDLKGSGANAIANLKVDLTGSLTLGVSIVSTGSGYSELMGANFPVLATPFSIKTAVGNGSVANPENFVQVKTGTTRTINAYYGTGTRERIVE
jgi:hypothetical protein